MLLSADDRYGMEIGVGKAMENKPSML